jgi:hypothetical protein
MYAEFLSPFSSQTVAAHNVSHFSVQLRCRYFGEYYDLDMMAVMNDIAFFQDQTSYLNKICRKNPRKKKAFNCSGIDVVSAARKVRNASVWFSRFYFSRDKT